MAKKKIMIIEDDMFVMDIYQTKFSLEGFEVISAENGIEALKKIEKENVVPDLMLLDIVMPYMDGLEVLKRLKENKNVSGVPVILLTNLSQKEQVSRGLELGASDYLIKSHFTPSEVMEKVKVYLKPETA